MPVQEATVQGPSKLRALLDIILSTVKETGPQGAPSGPMYMAFMTFGCSLEQYETMVGTLVDAGFLRRSGHVLYWIKDLPV